MLWSIVSIVVGIVVLVIGADRFVGAAAFLARHYGLPAFLVGIVVIGFGTSVPEMLVSATGAWRGTPGIALGNAFGSNISNILLILGCCTLVSTLKVTPDATRREMPMLLAATALVLILIYNGVISRLDAVVMLVFFAASMYMTIRDSLAKRNALTAEEQKVADEIEADIKPMPVWAAYVWVVAGLGLMIFSSNLLVNGSVWVARYFGVSDLVIGLTIVAVGTSLPELASSIAATRRGEDDLALGNIIGSNNFNTLLVVGIAGVIMPLPADPELFRRDLPVMVGATVLLYIFCRFKSSDGRITRPVGMLFLALYVAYTLYLIMTATAGVAETAVS